MLLELMYPMLTRRIGCLRSGKLLCTGERRVKTTKMDWFDNDWPTSKRRNVEEHADGVTQSSRSKDSISSYLL